MQPLAIFTITRNEPHWLPVWLRYYSTWHPFADIHVLQHTTLTSLQTACPVSINRVALPHPEIYDGPWLRQVVDNYRKFLLTNYRAVLFVPVDTFLWSVDDLPDSLIDVTANHAIPTHAVIQLPTDTMLATHNNILQQRTACEVVQAQSVLTTRPYRSSPGFVSDLPLLTSWAAINLARADYSRYVQRHQSVLDAAGPHVSQEWLYKLAAPRDHNKFTTHELCEDLGKLCETMPQVLQDQLWLL